VPPYTARLSDGRSAVGNLANRSELPPIKVFYFAQLCKLAMQFIPVIYLQIKSMLKESWMQPSSINSITRTDCLATAPARSDQKFVQQRQPLAAVMLVAGGAV